MFKLLFSVKALPLPLTQRVARYLFMHVQRTFLEHSPTSGSWHEEGPLVVKSCKMNERPWFLLWQPQQKPKKENFVERLCLLNMLQSFILSFWVKCDDIVYWFSASIYLKKSAKRKTVCWFVQISFCYNHWNLIQNFESLHCIVSFVDDSCLFFSLGGKSNYLLLNAFQNQNKNILLVAQ